MAAGAIRRPRLDTGHLTDVHCSVAVRVCPVRVCASVRVCSFHKDFSDFLVKTGSHASNCVVCACKSHSFKKQKKFLNFSKASDANPSSNDQHS